MPMPFWFLFAKWAGGTRVKHWMGTDTGNKTAQPDDNGEVAARRNTAAQPEAEAAAATNTAAQPGGTNEARARVTSAVESSSAVVAVSTSTR